MISKTHQQLETLIHNVRPVFASGVRGSSTERRVVDWFVPKLLAVLALSAVLTAIWYAALAMFGVVAVRWAWALLF